MSAIIRAYGADFDVDAFLADCSLPVCATMRKGEPVFPNAKPNGEKHTSSGLHIVASEADFEEFPKQVAESTEFLRINADEIRRLLTFPGIEWAILDYGVARRDVAIQCDYLPPELLLLAGSLGLGIELSAYPWKDDSTGAQPAGCAGRRDSSAIDNPSQASVTTDEPIDVEQTMDVNRPPAPQPRAKSPQ